jgi:hypothetical protein
MPALPSLVAGTRFVLPAGTRVATTTRTFTLWYPTPAIMIGRLGTSWLAVVVGPFGRGVVSLNDLEEADR